MARSGHPGSDLARAVRAAVTRRATRAAAGGVAAIAVVAGAALLAGFGRATASAPTPARVSSESPVTATDLIGRVANNSPQLAVDPTEPRFVVMATRRDAPFDCALQVSGDGGVGWLTVRPVEKLPSGADTCYGPEVGFDADGLLYYLFIGLHGSGNSPMGVFLTTSSDRAQHFSTPRKVLGAERYQVRMAIDPGLGAHGRIHIVWLEARTAPPTGGLPAGRNPIMTAYSDDGGATLSTPVQVSDDDRPRAVAPSVALGSDHSVHIVYYDLRDDARDYQGLDGPTWTGRWSLISTRSDDAGDHFERGVVVDSDIVPMERVMLIFTMAPASLASDHDEHLFVAWADARNGDWDVFLRRSLDGGGSWDAPVRLNDDPLHDGRNQYLPKLSVSPSGRVDAIFYDRRSNAENRGNDVSYTYSLDTGRTFSPNLRINSLTFDSFIGPRYLVTSAKGLREIGSRLALLSEDSRVVAAWTDTRHTYLTGKAQDIFSASVDAPSPASDSSWGRLIGAGLVVVGISGIGALLLLRHRRAASGGEAARAATDEVLS